MDELGNRLGEQLEVRSAMEKVQQRRGMSAGDRIAVRYAPIVSLSDGTLYGYEAIPFDAEANASWDSSLFYAESEAEGNLYDNDRRFRELAIRGVPAGPRAVKLFLPVPARIVYDPRLYPGSTLGRIEAAGLRPDHVVLLLSDESDGHPGTLHAAIRHYRTQGFRIAFSGLKTGRTALERMVDLKPDYVRIGTEWFPRTLRDPAGESLLQAISALARKEKIVLLADGLEREEQIRPLMTYGVGYGEGLWLGVPSETPRSVDPSVTDRIRQEMRRRFRGAAGALLELTEPAVTFPSSTPVTEIARFFEIHREAPGFVILKDGKPVGMLMKEKLHQTLARQFGLPLYGNRPVSKIMDAQPLIVDESTPVEQLSQTAMAREPDKLYDAVIVTRKGEVSGIVSIRALLEWVTTMRMSNAQWANPLTGLPGNEPIRRELSRRLDEGRPFSVLYADLDYFKWYNDQYGFHRGDDVIRYTSESLQAAVRKYSPDDSFVGHIGGDDFIVIFDYGNPVRIGEEMLAEFERGISSFLDRTHGPVRDRSGTPVEGASLSLSLAVLSCQVTEGWTPERLAEYSALLKKAAKTRLGSALEWETLEEFHAFAERKGLTVR
ncbi:EAL domain-containing protein [Cohnella sp. CFH 77786]|uniref:EAL domain-containing protein n=1 Tax=Cohnella sp. CFH 77786 TaxID=2662265 RepID=UPI001C6091E1|nr:EAL domain-containing protein [Cohnella sp. CFH 77786]MBW5449107.1 EAL domain-containing protein [Cohnella sp. CFH 77786]